MASYHCLVTGGLGFIGSHTVVQLLNSNYKVTIIDNLSNSNEECLNRIKMLCPGKEVCFYKIDLLDENILDETVNSIQNSSLPIDSCIHFAGFKAVGESTEKPLYYYNNNLISTINLLKIMKKYDINKMVFSSSSTVYGSSEQMNEEAITGINLTNPYAKTKYMIEEMLKDYSQANKSFKCTILRYFNPVGAHPSGLIGEDPLGIPNNLMPYICQVAIGKRDMLHIFGNDYPTPDGTCIRDYIHVMDLSRGHLLALEYSDKIDANNNCNIFNIGSGCGYSVLEVYNAMCKASGKDIQYVITGRRQGDLVKSVADTTKSEKILNFKTEYGIDKICEDAWNWQTKNPHGY
jgi:UDP-glucose 4-epimerase